jgi:hypothetical protein
MVFGGTKDDADLNAWSLLTGDREEDVATRDRDSGSSSVTNRRVPVLTPAQIAQLKPKQVLIISRSMPVSIGRVQMVWNRPDVRKLARRDKTAALLQRLADRLVTAHGWTVETTMRAAEYAAGRIRLGVEWAVPRLMAGFDWLDANDPARALVARLRLTWAMREARAALRARTATPRPYELPAAPEKTDGPGAAS